MKLGWSGFRSAFAFAIIAVTSAPEANSFSGGGGVWAMSCRAIVAVITRVRIAQRTRTRIRPPVRRRLYSIGDSCRGDFNVRLLRERAFAARSSSPVAARSKGRRPRRRRRSGRRRLDREGGGPLAL